MSTNFDPSTDVSECVGIVVDTSHDYYGMIGQVTYHDWSGTGRTNMVGLVMNDGQQLDLYDGGIPDDFRPPQVRIRRRDDPAAEALCLNLWIRTTFVGLDVERYKATSELYSPNERRAAKQAFVELLGSIDPRVAVGAG